MREGLTLTGLPIADLAPGDALETCTILTTEANATLAPIHPRMPVMLPPEDYDSWLGGRDRSPSPPTPPSP